MNSLCKVDHYLSSENPATDADIMPINIGEEQSSDVGDVDDDETAEPALKLPRLFSYLSKANTKATQSTSNTQTAAGQYVVYLEVAKDTDNVEAMSFWLQHKNRFNLLYNLAIRVLGTPATSAAIERVFSHGGILIRPHRASLSDTLLCDLIFAKCNKQYGLQF